MSASHETLKALVTSTDSVLWEYRGKNIYEKAQAACAEVRWLREELDKAQANVTGQAAVSRQQAREIQELREKVKLLSQGGFGDGKQARQASGA